MMAGTRGEGAIAIGFISPCRRGCSMSTLWQVTALAVICSGMAAPSTASAGSFWNWGYPGYANSSFYAPGGTWAAYGPSYFGPSSGCCGSGSCGASGCGSCQTAYNFGCGCDPCGCSPCGGSCGGCDSCGSCGMGGCSSGNCANGNCGLNAAPADMAPRPEDPNSLPQPSTNPAPSSNDRVPPRRTFDNEPSGTDAPMYEPPATNPMVDPMLDPATDGFGPTNPGRTNPGTSPRPFGGGSGIRTNEPAPADGSFPSRTTPRRPAPTSAPTEDPLDPASNPVDGFGASKPVLPGESATGSPMTPAPADAIEVQEPEANNEDLNRGPRLDLKSTTAPVVPKTRLAVQPRGQTVAAQQRPLAREEWSVAPTPLGVVYR